MALVQTEAVDTPLQGNLTQLAAAIGKIGLFAGILCFVALMIRCCSQSHCALLYLTVGSSALGRLL